MRPVWGLRGAVALPPHLSFCLLGWPFQVPSWHVNSPSSCLRVPSQVLEAGQNFIERDTPRAAFEIIKCCGFGDIGWKRHSPPLKASMLPGPKSQSHDNNNCLQIHSLIFQAELDYNKRSTRLRKSSLEPPTLPTFAPRCKCGANLSIQ